MLITQHRVYLGTGSQLPEAFRFPNGTPSHKYIEVVVLAHLESFNIKGATLVWSTGVWEGEKEESLIIELISVPNHLVLEFGRALRESFNQDSVLVTVSEITAVFLSK